MSWSEPTQNSAFLKRFETGSADADVRPAAVVEALPQLIESFRDCGAWVLQSATPELLHKARQQDPPGPSQGKRLRHQDVSALAQSHPCALTLDERGRGALPCGCEECQSLVL
jgi:hypothetical protein